MLSESSSRDRALTESLHHRLLHHFYEACDPSLQDLLAPCNFGFAPSPTQEQTFFIVAQTREETDTLSERTDEILAIVSDLMPGIRKLALCCTPPQSSSITTPRFLSGRIFTVPAFSEDNA